MLVLALIPVLWFAPPSDTMEGDPVSSVTSIEVPVFHWEGTFGTYLVPQRGTKIRIDLTAVGKDGLLTVLGKDAGTSGTLPLAHLEIVADVVEGSARTSWRRRIVLKGSRESVPDERTVLEIVIQYELEQFEERDGRRVKLSSNRTHTTVTLHTLRADDTIREYGKALCTLDRDRGVVVFPADDRR